MSAIIYANETKSPVTPGLPEASVNYALQIIVNNKNTIASLAAQVAALTSTVQSLVTNFIPQDTVSLSEPVRDISHAAFGRPDTDNSDPNIVRVHITEGYVRNRMTLPREIYTKSKRDSYIHAQDTTDREVTDPARSYVVVDGVKYPQTVNQGRSSKIQVSTFGAKEGQTVVFTKIKGNQWASVVKGKSSHVEPAKSKSLKAQANGKGQSAGKFQFGGKVQPPSAKKTQAKPASTPKSAGSASLNSAIETAVKQIQANYGKGFVNDAIVTAANKRGISPVPARCYLQTAQNRVLKEAAKNAGTSILKIDKQINKLVYG